MHTWLSFFFYYYCRDSELSYIREIGSSLHLLKRELGSLTCLRMALPEQGAPIYSMIRTACQLDQITIATALDIISTLVKAFENFNIAASLQDIPCRPQPQHVA